MRRPLHLMEPRLRLVQEKEFTLPNTYGARGYIDILARDIHDMWVIVEINRPTTSSWQALHEVAKYAEPFCREKHSPPAADR